MKENLTFKAWLPTIIVVVAAMVNDYLIPFLAGKEASWSWPAFGVISLTALINALRQNDNPFRFVDSTVAGIIVAVINWIIVSLQSPGVELDWKGLLVVVLPILLGAFSRGLGKGYQSPDGGT